MVVGVRKSIVKGLIWGRIIWLALRAYRNPRQTTVALRRLLAQRAKTQRWTTGKFVHAGGRYFWHLYAPGFPSRAFDAFVERELDRVESFRDAPPALQTAVFAITKRCSFRCEHCCEWLALNALETLAVADLHAIVARVRARGASQIFLSGGEPLRRFEDLVSIIGPASVDADVWILSTGHGLTAERARRLRAAGLTGIALSLDHWDPQQHDGFRGIDGAFRWVERAAEQARGAGLLVALSLCPTREFTSRGNIERYAAVARRLGAGFIQLFEPKAIGHYAGRNVVLSPDQQELLEAFSLRLNTDPELRELPAVSYLEASARASQCVGAGNRHIYIDTDGMVNPCPFCRSPAGRVLDGDFDATLECMQVSGCPATTSAAH